MAATITSSTFTLGTPQGDGTVYVTEVHTWDSGLAQQQVEYGPVPTGLDFQSIADARALVLMQSARENEQNNNVQNDQYILIYSTEDEMLAYVRELYRDFMGLELCRISRWIIDRINDSSFTTTAIRTAFGYSNPDWNQLQNGKMDLQAASWTTVQNAVGE